jgi:TatD DNase family protein
LPHRGKVNNPSFVAHVAAALAQVIGIAVEEVAQTTSANFERLFGIPALAVAS